MAQHPVRFHLDMSQLTREARSPIENLAIDNYSQTNSPVNIDCQNLRLIHGIAKAVLADGGGLRIVEETHGEVEMRFEVRYQRHARRRQVQVG
ncbi:hypothetical protein D3C87_1978390 [compost metagenome]